MNNIYKNNSEIVRKIAKKLGYKLINFDPHWALIETTIKHPYSYLETIPCSIKIPYTKIILDEFMSDLAISMNYNWEFSNTTEDAKEYLSLSRVFLKMDMDAQKSLNKCNKNIIPQYDSTIKDIILKMENEIYLRIKLSKE